MGVWGDLLMGDTEKSNTIWCEKCLTNTFTYLDGCCLSCGSSRVNDEKVLCDENNLCKGKWDITGST